MKISKLYQNGFTAVEIVIGLAVVVALIGGGSLIYKRVKPHNPFKANASAYAFVYDQSNMSYTFGQTHPLNKVDGVAYKVLGKTGPYTIESLVTASQLTFAKKLCAHFKTFGTPNTDLYIEQFDTNRNKKLTNHVHISTNGTGNVCTGAVYVGSGIISVHTTVGATADIGIDTIYATL